MSIDLKSRTNTCEKEDTSYAFDINQSAKKSQRVDLISQKLGIATKKPLKHSINQKLEKIDFLNDTLKNRPSVNIWIKDTPVSFMESILGLNNPKAFEINKSKLIRSTGEIFNAEQTQYKQHSKI